MVSLVAKLHIPAVVAFFHLPLRDQAYSLFKFCAHLVIFNQTIQNEALSLYNRLQTKKYHIFIKHVSLKAISSSTDTSGELLKA